MRMYPESTITLYAGVEIDNGEQLAFSSENQQAAYFHSKYVRTVSDCMYIKKTGEFRVPVSMLEVSQCNYLSFTNPYDTAYPATSGKTVYARIIDFDYINNETTSVVYAIDFWQTWMFDVTFEDCYIEREHLSEYDWDLAEHNPYNPNIAEFRTAESLPITEDNEKLTYTFGTSLSDDGIRIQDVIETELGVSNTLGVLVKMSDIDFDELDNPAEPYPSGTDVPSKQFIDWLTANIESEGMGFWALPWGMYEYLHDKYPSRINQNSFVGTDWNGLSPFTSNDYRANVMYIYDPNGGTSTSKLGGLLTRLVKWNCVSSIIDMNIIPNSLMLTSGVDIQTGGVLQANQKTVKTLLNVTNKKLMMFPFSYLRVIAPNGDVKELHFENFADVQAGYDTCAIGMVLDISDKPNLIIAPYKYKMTGISNEAVNDYNIYEGLYFKQFPTAPYSIDAFLAQVANVSYETIANSTLTARLAVQNQQDLRATEEQTHNVQLASRLASLAGSVGSSGGGAGALAGGALGLLVGAGNVASEANFNLTNEQKKQNLWLQEQMMSDAENIAVSSMSRYPGGILNNMAYTRQAYAANKYTPSNGVGTSNFNIMCSQNVLYQRVTLNPTILSRYDNYFTHYGYSSGRCGIPRVVNFVHGSQSSTDVPHWLTVNGKPATYIKTVDCKVIHSMIPVAEYIRAMFDNGIRMIKGDPNP